MPCYGPMRTVFFSLQLLLPLLVTLYALILSTEKIVKLSNIGIVNEKYNVLKEYLLDGNEVVWCNTDVMKFSYIGSENC